MNTEVVAPATRNSLCPCGSGRRYKECHGALVAPHADTSVPRRSTYRAPGSEWAHLDDTKRDRLGARMEHALAMQRAGRIAEATRAYREVVAVAPDTHDAQHMLGIIELGLGNLDEAERLIAAAMRLRAPYPAILHNWELLRDARFARARGVPEQLAQPALPILAELALGSRAESRSERSGGAWTASVQSASVHLIGRANAGDHDDSWSVRRLAHVLDRDCTLWAADGNGPDGGLGEAKLIDAATGAVPRGGTHVFVGVDFDCAAWIERANAARVIVFCQSAAPTRYLDQLREIARHGARPVELVFPSQAMADRFGQGHTVLPPLIDLERAGEFASYEERLGTLSPAWPIGIVGQNPQFVCEPPDGEFISGLASITGRLDVYDPGRIRYVLGASPMVRFFPRRPAGLEPFLARLACFVHRTETWWQDTVGRELYGAMALGVPVLCPRASIHAERIEHGVDGLLYGSSAEARELLSDLRQSPATAAEMGRAGRNKMRILLDGVAQTRNYREFLAGTGPPTEAVKRNGMAKVA
jgi:hypothetical protein